MILIQRLFRFFIFSSLFIALCAVLMVHQTFQLFDLSQPGINLYGFIFFSTICSYNFHWYLTTHAAEPSQRIAWAQKYKNIHLFLFLIGLTGSSIFFITLLAHWQWILLAVFITFLYSAPKFPNEIFHFLKKIAFGKTIFLTTVWTYVTTLMPLLITDNDFTAATWLFTGSRFFLVYAICIIFDVRDKEDDKLDGIRSLVTYFDEQKIKLLFYGCLVVFAACTIGLKFHGYGLLTISMLLLPGIICGTIYNYAQKNHADIFYYFVLDGLMMLSALLMLVL